MTTESRLRLSLDGLRKAYQPGDMIVGEYRVDRPLVEVPKAIELAVLWHTEGKGDEDLAVHYFDRRSVEDGPMLDLHRGVRFSTVLPNSPLSYDGVIVRICWCVRVRVFLPKGKELMEEAPFRLGRVPPGRLLTRATHE